MRYVSDAHRIIVKELERYVGESLQDRKRIAIPCPFHNETQPSLYINIDGRSRKHPVGSYYCFGCRAKTSTHGGWNGLASLLNLAQIDGTQSQVTTFVAPSRERLTAHFDDQEGFDWQQLLDVWNIEFATPWSRDQSFRGVPGWLMRRTGAYLVFDEQRETSYAVLVQHTNGVLVGAIKAVLRPTARTRVKYLNAGGSWVKTHGLWPWQTAEQMVECQRRLDQRVVVALVEGPRDALRLLGCGIPALAILGSNNWTVEKRDLLVGLDPDLVLFAFDNDSGGKLAYDLVAPTLKGFSATRQTSYAWAERVHRRAWQSSHGDEPWTRPKLDPGSVDVEQIRRWRIQHNIQPVSLRQEVFDAHDFYPMEQQYGSEQRSAFASTSTSTSAHQDSDEQ